MNIYVSRQISWPDGFRYVEIETGGPDMASPGELAGRLGGEGEYTDPREAVEAAIALWETWQAVEPYSAIGISLGTTLGGVCVHDPDMQPDLDALRAWAEERYEDMPKCDRCGDPLGKETWTLPDYDYADERFCSENCADLAREFYEEVEAELDDELDDEDDDDE